MFGGKKKAAVVTETYENEKDRDRAVAKMAKDGYVVQSMTPTGGNFKAGKAGAMAVGGALIAGPLGLAAGALAGRKAVKWHVVYILK